MTGNPITYEDRPPGGPAGTTTDRRPRWPRPRLRAAGGDRVIGGVAAAVAGSLGVDATVVRIAFVVLSVLGGAALPLYAAGWLLIPEEGAELSIAQKLVRSRVGNA